ncbi:cleavage and polyadenylation specificity factor subunit 1-like isoform X1 [Dreissena polymorpha]|uniref:cleavage and polyadenylation specificity factor subunit 1-like isoform X1 n=1 Tax=Dreissena polymorpha TaxID=45954 RepID=UPI0022647D4F|nr:cleavage and polyadenylation specificity factor subunit 1-like isoform X1 [Dreissena polymorpha]
MYAIYKQLHPPTGVEHCVYCNFLSGSEQNLVIAAVNQIHVYRLTPDTEQGIDKDGNEEEIKQKLECLATFSLFGNVMSMKSVRLPGATKDALLLAFADAKLSVVEYDPGMHDLQTTSLHHFEETKFKDFSDPTGIPTVRVDPDGRCAAMLIYGTKLVVLPFRKDVYSEDVEGIMDGDEQGTKTRYPIQNSYIIDMRSFDEKIINILDFQFLHGYYEPTVFILYEPYPTWAGRVAVRSDTCSIVAISLNIPEKVHPIIWSLSHLPFDCLHCQPVPKPIGGVLVFAVNSLLYLNQSVPPYGVSLNSMSSTRSVFPLKVQDGVRITLDCSQSTFISSDKLVVSLKGGELYVLTLIVDGMRSVRGFNFDKSAASVLTTCMCLCEEGYLFLGSRLGNSLLLKYTEKAQTVEKEAKDKDKPTEPPTKKKKTEGPTDMASDVLLVENLDELEVYGASENPSGTTITSYVFEVCDNIWNIAPCGMTVMGEPAFLSEEFNGTVDPDLELVTTSGYGKNGALSVLQRSIRPQVVTTFELPSCMNMWTVMGPPQEEGQNKEGEETGGHAFLILTRSDSSMILQTGQEIQELDHSGFSTQTATVYAGNIGDGRYIVQVSSGGVRLIDGVQQLQHIPIEMGTPIVHCSVADPYILITSEEGMVMMLTLKLEASGARLVLNKPLLASKPRILAICAYKDESGMFTTAPLEVDEEEARTDKRENMNISLEKVFNMENSTVDDEDELLYGDGETSGMDTSVNASVRKEMKTRKGPVKKEVKTTYWLTVCRENGSLEIVSVPDFKICYYVKTFPIGQKVLVDSLQLDVKASSSNQAQDKGQPDNFSNIVEILMVGLGHRKSRPYLLARSDDGLLIYEAFQYHQSKSDNHLKLRFKKIQHNLILKERKVKSRKRGDVEIVDEFDELKDERGQWFRYFEDISGYSGVFICGPYPHWLFMTQRGSLRIHPMGIDGAITCFAPFHNVNCPKGFLYFNKQGEMRISVLPTHLTYDAPWPIRKVPLRCTPHFLVYHMDSKTYAVVMHNPDICNKLPKTTSEEREFEVFEKDERFVYPTAQKFLCQLYSPTSWEVVPNTQIEMEEFEHVTTLKYVPLKSEETVSGYKGYIAIGTSICLGEDILGRGRIIIFDIIEVVPEPGQPLTKHKIKVIYDKEQKGPVSALTHCSGYLVSSIGQKIFMWTLKDNDLVGIAFIDTHIYIHQLVTIKCLIFAADVQKSVTLYRYQDAERVLSQVARDVKPMEIYTLDFFIDGTQLSFVVTDKLKNIIIYQYQPETRESHGGTRLVRRADMNAGSHIHTMFRVRCKLSDPSTEKKLSGPVERRHVTYFATLDGSIGYLLPIQEKVYRRLLMLQNALSIQIPHNAGLNPKAYRAVQTDSSDLVNAHKNILDGELLWKFLHLSILEKNETAKRIGTSVDQLVEDLMETDRLTAHF